MVVAPVLTLPHPLLAAVELVERGLNQMSIESWDGLAPTEIKALAERLMRADARIKAHQFAASRVLDASGLAKTEGASSTGAMLANSFGGDKRAGDQLVRMGQVLEAAPQTENALTHGRIGPSQAAIIASAVADLPAETTPEQKQACEDTLIADASKYSLKDLRNRSMRIADQFKTEPEVDQIENDTLERRERRAWARSEFTMVNEGDGTCSGRFRIPEAQGDMLLAAIKALSAHRRDHLHQDTPAPESYYDRDLEYRNRLGMGFAELASHLPGNVLPGKGGLGPTLMVHFDHDTLVEGIKAATLSGGTRISATQVRLMACNAGIIPLVFGGKPLPLDHGHEQRLFTKAQKQAQSARDCGCTFPGCDKPPEECESHHWRMRWADGSETQLDDGVLECPFHHRLVHRDGWSIRMSPVDGYPEYRRTHSEPWRRNTRWRP